jgi:DNA-binding IclR family transcriptional regulator
MPDLGANQQVADRPALAVLLCVAAHGAEGVSRGSLAQEGWPTRTVNVPLSALRSRGYVAYDGTTGRWTVTDAGLRRAAQATSSPGGRGP